MDDETRGASPRPYRFGPRDRRGLVAGLRAGQLVPAAGGLLVALGALRSLGREAGAGVALVALAAGLAAGFVPVAGRTLDEWAPCVLGFLAARSRPGRAQLPPVPCGPRRGAFAQLDVIDLGRVEGKPAGGIRDRRHGRVTAVVCLPAEGFALLGGPERARRVASWSGLLASLAGHAGAIERLAWIERTVPDAATGLGHHAPGAPSSAARSYERLLAAERCGLLRHELLLACSLAWRGGAPRSEPAGPGAGERSGPAGEVERLLGRCRAAGFATARALSPTEVDGLVAGCTAAAAAAAAATATATASGGAGSWPWPLGVAEEWSCLRTDATWHACYWIAEWPRSAVGDDFLLPLLLGSWTRRAVAVVMAPRPPQRALRLTEHARTEKVADLELRRRHGFAVTARLDQERRAVERREEELAAGHAAYRFSGYVTVTAEGRAELERACRTLEQAAALARLELRRLYGSQAEAFCCTLPAGRGCR